MQYNIQNDAITLTTLKYSATVFMHSFSLRFNGHFPDEPGLASVY